jgi:Type IV secretion system pilin
VHKNIKLSHVFFWILTIIPLFMSHPAFADPAGVTQVESFMQSVIQALAGLAGLVATAFIMIGGFGYITSSGNPARLEKAKRTLLHSGVGLVIVIGAFVISSIITSLATKAFGS